MQKEKLDFLVAVGEKLCHMESSPEMQRLEGLTDASSGSKTEKNHKWDSGSNEEFADIVSEMIANQLMAEPTGQESLKALYR